MSDHQINSQNSNHKNTQPENPLIPAGEQPQTTSLDSNFFMRLQRRFGNKATQTFLETGKVQLPTPRLHWGGSHLPIQRDLAFSETNMDINLKFGFDRSSVTFMAINPMDRNATVENYIMNQFAKAASDKNINNLTAPQQYGNMGWLNTDGFNFQVKWSNTDNCLVVYDLNYKGGLNHSVFRLKGVINYLAQAGYLAKPVAHKKLDEFIKQDPKVLNLSPEELVEAFRKILKLKDEIRFDETPEIEVKEHDIFKMPKAETPEAFVERTTNPILFRAIRSKPQKRGNDTLPPDGNFVNPSNPDNPLANYLYYRSLGDWSKATKEQERSIGTIEAVKPDAITSIADHVGGGVATQFISFSKNFEPAATTSVKDWKQKDSRSNMISPTQWSPVIRIDVTKLGKSVKIYDLTRDDIQNDPEIFGNMESHYSEGSQIAFNARKDAEVLIEGVIPPEAVINVINDDDMLAKGANITVKDIAGFLSLLGKIPLIALQDLKKYTLEKLDIEVKKNDNRISPALEKFIRETLLQ